MKENPDAIAARYPHILWYLAASRKLPKSVLHRIEMADVVFISAASIWEAGIKIRQGRLQANPDELFAGIAYSGFIELPITATHSLLAANLPEHHRDPFDRAYCSSHV